MQRLALFLLLATVLTAMAADELVISAMDDPATWTGGPFAPEVVQDNGRTCLVFDFGAGGQGTWELKTFPGLEANLNDYDELIFDFRVEGGGVNISTDIRKWPWFGGYLSLFYQVDDIFRPREWVAQRAGMQAPENNWAKTYSRDEPVFQLKLSGAANAGESLRVYIDNIRAIRYPVAVDCIEDVYMLFGDREDTDDGGLLYRYELTLRNRTDAPMPVAVDFEGDALTHFVPALESATLTAPPAATATVPLTLTMSTEARRQVPTAYSERLPVRVVPNGRDNLAYRVTLQAAVPHPLPGHPTLFATGEQIARAREWQEKWGWARSCARWYRNRAEFAMNIPLELPEYRPRPEQPGDRVCPNCGDATELYTVTRDDSVFRYQCLACGKMLSPKLEPLRDTSSWAFQDDGYWWHPDRPSDKNPVPGHAVTFNRHGNLLDLAVAWHLTGDTRYRDRAAEILAAYAELLPTYPFARSWGASQYCVLDAKGAFRVGNYFSQNGWLHRMACTLDLLWDSGAVPENVRETLLAELRLMGVNRLRMVNTGSHRLNEALVAVAMLGNDANLLAYALDDPIMGARPTLRVTMLDDGMNYMAGQYQEPVMAAWMPVLHTYRNAGFDLPGQIPGMRRYAIAIQQWLDPDGYSPSLGDARAAASLRNEDHMELCYNWFGDPDIINGVQRRLYRQWQASDSRQPWESLQRQGGNAILEAGAALFRCAENVPRGNPEPFRGSYNFPDYGLLVFNQGKSDKQLWAAMPYGRQLGHGHHDNLHLEWWALGQTISQKQGSRSRHHAVHENTLLVDSRDQAKIPCDLVEWVSEGPVQGAVLASEAMYPGTRITRTIMLYDGLVFLFDTFASDTEHDYDMVYANAGTLQCDLPFKPLGRPLGDDRSAQGFPTGYASLEDPHRAPAPDLLQATWDNLAQPDVRVRLTQLAVGDSGDVLRVRAPLVVCDWKEMTDDIDAAGYTRLERNRNASEDRSDFLGPKLIRRVHARQVALLTILEPYRGDTPRLTDIQRLPVILDGEPTAFGLAVRYRSGGVAHQVVLCPEPGTKTAGGWTTDHRFTAGTFGPRR